MKTMTYSGTDKETLEYVPLSRSSLTSLIPYNKL